MLARLGTPERIQAFVDALPANHELGGETVLSVREVLRQRRAHCIEAAFVAACALWVHGRPPLVMHMDCDRVRLAARRSRSFAAAARGARSPRAITSASAIATPFTAACASSRCRISTNTCDRRGRRTLASYSPAFDLRRIDPAAWVTAEAPCWDAHDRLAALRHTPLVTARQRALLSRLDPFERRIASVAQYPRPPRARRLALPLRARIRRPDGGCAAGPSLENMLKIFYAPASPFVRKCLVAATELGLRDRIELVTAAAHPVNRDANVVAHNPLGKIPTLITDEGIVLYDSRVICEYLNALGDGRLIPREATERLARARASSRWPTASWMRRC